MFKFIDVKKWSIIAFFLMRALTPFAQASYIDSLKQAVEETRNDTILYIQLDALVIAYWETKPDSSLYYSEKALAVARKLKLRLNEAFTMVKKGYAQQNKGDYPGSLRTYLSALEIANNPENDKSIFSPGLLVLNSFSPNTPAADFRMVTLAQLHEVMAILYENVNDYEKELYHLHFTRQYVERSRDTNHLAELYYILGRVYLSLQKYDSAFFYERKAYDLARDSAVLTRGPLLTLGKYYLAIGKDQEAGVYLRSALEASQHTDYTRGQIASSLLLSAMARKQGKTDSSFYFTNASLLLAEQMRSPDLLLRTWSELVEIYNLLNRHDSTAKYQALIIAMKDSLFNSKQAQLFHNIYFDEQQRQQEIEIVRKTYKERVQKYGLLAGLAVFLAIAVILWRNNRNKQRAYSVIKRQKQETEFQKSKVEQTLNELKAAQAQLIQSEKMASLGELTAGIAHEIENPLNFVNNFSDMNKELLVEMKDEMKKGNLGAMESIADNVIENEEKINHHGKRADAIVKGMLQHSRTSTGQKELIDINALSDEYLRLAYHGLRAKDKSFNAEIKTDFDNSIGKIKIVPQDIGRVILNLINNAFYAVTEKKKTADEQYQPTVTISTTSISSPLGGRGVEIKVIDNGGGIPKNIVDKIFQPFFTTKPTGQGTGLGLSLAYDIVKAHGGEIRLENQEGEGCAFIIHLSA